MEDGGWLTYRLSQEDTWKLQAAVVFAFDALGKRRDNAQFVLQQGLNYIARISNPSTVFLRVDGVETTFPTSKKGTRIEGVIICSHVDIFTWFLYFANKQASMDKFSYPEYYDFPPFFTLQPVRATREKQLVLWQQLILEYHRAHDLPLFQPLASTLFENVKISRNMAQDGRMAVVEHLIRCGHGRWEDDTKTRCRIMWKNPPSGPLRSTTLSVEC
ncbi:ESCRT-II complex, Vps25 subunit, N-terminal winged helix [Phytophthora cactorum]|nr:ESCRT-II complex, Vps25 subunit, N-terminal winged helix [Phytophthora cactorum]